MSSVRAELPPGLGSRISGTADWALTLFDRAGQSQWTLESTLRGAEIDLPSPVGKIAADARSLKVERRPDAPGGGDTLSLALEGAGRVVTQRRLADGKLIPGRVLVLLGRATQQPSDASRAGVWVRGDLPSFPSTSIS